MNDFDYIKKVSSNINISKICRKLNIDRANLVSGRTSFINAKLVRKEIESEIAKLYIDPELLKDNKEEN